jgi:hypothetical protein
MKLIKEIKSRTGVLHFRRYELLKTRFFSIWIHHIFESDKDEHLHNHPWNFISIPFSGEYIELTQSGEKIQKLGVLNIRNGKDYHKILKINKGPVKTIFISFGPKSKKWGYLVNGEHIDFDKYRI